MGHTFLLMPELPEVETVRRSLARHVEGRTVTEVEVGDPYVLRGQAVEVFREGLTGQTLRSTCRHGKLLFFPLEDKTLIVHLGMTGQLTIRLPHRHDTPFAVHKKTGLQRTLQHAPDKHTHISLYLDNGAALHYRDIRKFGRFFHLPIVTEDKVISHFNLGVDPLTEAFTTDYLKRGLAHRKVALKAALLDQKFIAGLGNIYVDEALFQAGLRPGRGAYRLTLPKCELLREAIVQVLEKGIEAGGTTLRDFVSGEGQAGYNQEGLLVYGRYGKPCPRCGSVLKRGVYGGRTTSWCSRCQQ